MSVDPTFTLSEDLPPEHSNVHRAVMTFECSNQYFMRTAPRRITFASGRTMQAWEGVVYRGNDLDYCEDFPDGALGSVSDEELQRIAARYETIPGGGSGCVMRPGAQGKFTWVSIGLGLLGLVFLRRRLDG